MIPAFLIGVVSAPLAGKVVKSLVRGTVKTTAGIRLQVKQLAAETAEESRDLTAEASTEMTPAGAPALSGVPGVAGDVVESGAAAKRPGDADLIDSGATAPKRRKRLQPGDSVTAPKKGKLRG